MVADGKLTLKGEIEAASKAEKLEWKPQEEQVDAFGNIVKIKVSADLHRVLVVHRVCLASRCSAAVIACAISFCCLMYVQIEQLCVCVLRMHLQIYLCAFG